MKRPSEHEELLIYRRLLVKLHTTIWTGQHEKTKDLLNRIGNYVYARTNSNGDWKQEEEMEILTLLDLDK